MLAKPLRETELSWGNSYQEVSQTVLSIFYRPPEMKFIQNNYKYGYDTVFVIRIERKILAVSYLTFSL